LLSKELHKKRGALLLKWGKALKDLLEVALDTDGEDADVLTVRGGLLDKSCVDYFFVFAECRAATVTYFKSAN